MRPGGVYISSDEEYARFIVYILRLPGPAFGSSGINFLLESVVALLWVFPDDCNENLRMVESLMAK
jgi:hypothetical protein